MNCYRIDLLIIVEPNVSRDTILLETNKLKLI